MTHTRYALVGANWHADIVGKSVDGFPQLIPSLSEFRLSEFRQEACRDGSRSSDGGYEGQPDLRNDAGIGPEVRLMVPAPNREM